jgi:hypothetical protein
MWEMNIIYTNNQVHRRHSDKSTFGHSECMDYHMATIQWVSSVLFLLGVSEMPSQKREKGGCFAYISSLNDISCSSSGQSLTKLPIAIGDKHLFESNSQTKRCESLS